jgi:hypothetical protein
MASKPHVLAAFTRHVVPYLEKILGHYVDVIPVRTVEDALQCLREDQSIALVLCGVYFNGSRMFELMRQAKQINPQLPFIACRILPALDMPRVSIEALTIALESLGASYVDVPQLEENYGQEAAEAEFRSLTLSRISRLV